MDDDMTRQCCKCRNVKPTWEFPPNRRIESGLDVRCSKCVAESSKLFKSKWREKTYLPHGFTV